MIIKKFVVQILKIGRIAKNIIEALWVVAGKLISNRELRDCKKKVIIFYVDSNKHRPAKIARELIKKKWHVIYVGQDCPDALGIYSECYFETELGKIDKILSENDSILIHLFSAAISINALAIIIKFNQRLIYDPTDVLLKNVRPLGLVDIYRGHIKLKVIFLLFSIGQKIGIALSGNIIFRDLQVVSSGIIDPIKRRKKNTILFSDYIVEGIGHLKKTLRHGDKVRVVSCGNILIFDHGCGSAVVEYTKILLDQGVEVVFYIATQGISLQRHLEFLPGLSEIMKNNKSFSIRESISEEELIKEINGFDYGLFIVGDHYYNVSPTDSNSIFSPHNYTHCGGARAATYLSANLNVISVDPGYLTYSNFLLRRYGNLHLLNPGGGGEKLRKKGWMKYESKNRLLMRNNIDRLTRYYDKTSRFSEVS